MLKRLIARLLTLAARLVGSAGTAVGAALRQPRRAGLLLAVVAAAAVVGFVAVNLRPGLWFVDNTPTGGDLGAHVWGPAYLRDALISEWRLTGWTHDWYAGFPAFTFYMVLPALAVVMVDVGLNVSEAVFAYLAVVSAAVVATREIMHRRRAAALPSWVAALLSGAVLGAAELTFDGLVADRVLAVTLLPTAAAACAWYGWAWFSFGSHVTRRPRLRSTAAAVAPLLVLTAVPMPYGVSLKLVTVAGLLALPAAVAAMTRLAGVAGEGQMLAVAATLLFLFDRSFNIYGGNLMSTMAGEFAYSLGLAAAILFVGFLARGMPRGTHQMTAGVLLAITGLMHLFTAFFALGVLAAFVLVSPWTARAWRRRASWTLVTGAVGAALSAWWVLPFWWNRDLLNDMGWGKDRRYLSALWSRSEFDYSFLTNDPPLQPFVVLAVMSSVLLFWRRSRLGMALAVTAAAVAASFVLLPEGRLWNVRILPFYYMAVYLLAALGAGEAISMGRRWMARRRVADDGTPSRLPAVLAGAAVALAGAAVVVTVALPLRSLPGGRLGDDGVYRWGPLSSSEINLGAYWVEYNFEGYEAKPPNPDGGGSAEYWDLVDTMRRVGETHGCGAALWEYEAARLGSYGTPMAPMLLPHWTDRCIGSMEGLYFESSATVPYHFLMQSQLSASPSQAQRDLPYSGLDVDAGAERMRTMGVRYYMAFSAGAVAQARASQGLTEIASTPRGPWVVFKVRDSATVTPLRRLPVVVESLDAGSDAWLEASVGAFLAGEETVGVLAADGPQDWPRMALPDARRDAGGREPGRQEAMRRLASQLPEAVPVSEIEPATVSNVVRDDHSISFSVDRAGAPVLVRTSYFPNWSVSGAEGPYRATPNFMVVVPTDTEVRLSYGRSPVELLGVFATLAGVAAMAPAALSSRSRRLLGDAGSDSDLASELDPVNDSGPGCCLGDAEFAPAGCCPGDAEFAPAGFCADDSELGSGLGVQQNPCPEESLQRKQNAVRFSVVVPAYQEADRIGTAVRELRAALGVVAADGGVEILVVDDGSRDGTSAAARAAGADQVVTLGANRGKGEAVRAGMRASSGDVIAFTDADLAYSPQQLAVLLDEIESGADVAIGDRRHRDSVAVTSPTRLRRVGSAAVAAVRAGLRLGDGGDSQCGLKAFSRQASATLCDASAMDRFSFDVEVLFLAKRFDMTVRRVPVRVVNRDASSVRLMSDGWDLMVDMCRIRARALLGRYPKPAEASRREPGSRPVVVSVSPTTPGPTSPGTVYSGAASFGSARSAAADLDVIFKAYDIRGVVGSEINEEACFAVGAAFAVYSREQGSERIVVGRDMRPDGPALSAAFCSGATAAGVDVLDIGLCATEMMYFASGVFDVGGAMFTASHNPVGYNGIKLCGPAAAAVGTGTGLERVKALAAAGAPSARVGGTVKRRDVLERYVEHVLSFVDGAALRPLRLAVDAANGMGALVAPAVFERLPVEVDYLYADLDGTFPNHPADPLKTENLADLRDRVRECGADAGLAFDGDADRVFAVDELSNPLSGSLTAALVASVMLGREQGATVVHNAICSKALGEVIAERGGRALRSRVGHSFMKQAMAASGAVCGGEHSGHYYFRDNYGADSSMIAVMILLEALSRHSGGLSDLAAPLDRYAASGEINTEARDPRSAVEEVAATFADYEQDRFDGLSVDCGDWWFNVRPSNTEPLLRLNLECRDRADLAARVAEVRAVLDGLA
ncbi:MAG: glycosyltransferase [Acidimicrobiaceae bacterium]|nr:glycosyltransferase [Acidimicrobiaceae bacterium]MCY4280544.1 glycosyltransferase [Acidimicrobiaceae bacterium]